MFNEIEQEFLAEAFGRIFTSGKLKQSEQLIGLTEGQPRIFFLKLLQQEEQHLENGEDLTSNAENMRFIGSDIILSMDILLIKAW